MSLGCLQKSQNRVGDACPQDALKNHKKKQCSVIFIGFPLIFFAFSLDFIRCLMKNENKSALLMLVIILVILKAIFYY
jgi:hypothetical protein